MTDMIDMADMSLAQRQRKRKKQRKQIREWMREWSNGSLQARYDEWAESYGTNTFKVPIGAEVAHRDLGNVLVYWDSSGSEEEQQMWTAVYNMIEEYILGNGWKAP